MRMICMLGALCGIVLATSVLSRDPPTPEVAVRVFPLPPDTLHEYLSQQLVRWESQPITVLSTSSPLSTPGYGGASQVPLEFRAQQTIQVLDQHIQHQKTVNSYLRDLDVQAFRARVREQLRGRALHGWRRQLQRQAQ